MLGSHLAELYGVETRVLMQAVRRNMVRFPQDFMFELTRQEIMRISQIVTSLKYSKTVYAFTEQGVAIMRVFVKLRDFLGTHKELAGKLAELERWLKTHDTEIQGIFDAIRRLMQEPKKSRRRIGFRVGEPLAPDSRGLT